MTVTSVEAAIKEFLSSPRPEVLCVRGRWGTGKTHRWKRIAHELRDKPGSIALGEYAYVSLFGVNSIAELKAQILQNTVVKSQIGDITNFSTINNAIATVERTGKKTVIQGLFAFLGNRSESLVSVLALMTSKQIICIDDLERKGAKLSSNDVLGFISYLKEERNCKIALLLNDEALEGEDRKQFAAYLEKVVDHNLLFAPTPEESINIAITDSDEASRLVQEHCTTLGLDNIRVVRKIHGAVKQIEPLLSEYKNDVFRDVLASLVLFGWMHHQPEIAPNLEFLQQHSRLVPGNGNKELSPESFRWATLLDRYGFTHLDDFDLVLMKGISDGYFTKRQIDEHATVLQQRVLQNEANTRFRDAWARLHYSFTSGEEVVVNIADVFKNEAFYLSVENLHGVVTLLRNFEKDAEASAVIDAFVSAKKGVKDAFDTSRVFLRDESLDSEVERRLDEARIAASELRSIDQIFLDLNDNAFSAETLTTLSSASVDEYVRVFKSYEGEDLRMILTGVFQYRRIGNASDAMKTIALKGREAIKVLAKESRVNEFRAKGWIRSDTEGDQTN